MAREEEFKLTNVIFVAINFNKKEDLSVLGKQF